MTEFEKELAASMQKAARMREAAPELVEALRLSERAVAEYYRYWTGGETRGSYDGKPERNGLWYAQRRARALLAKIDGEQA